MSTLDLKGEKVALGQMTVGKKLGEGGFGVVHEAALSGVDFRFAVKFLDPSPFNNSEKARERFFKEAELLLKLRHPHIIAIYGLGEHEGRPYILMEKFDGFSVEDSRGHATATADGVLAFIERIADAMAFAHSKNVVHRDITPRNLMTIRGDARVLDFGIAAVLDPDRKRLTGSGGIGGDAFSAPEYLADRKLIDPRCDIYSVGACWLWVLTGKTPSGMGWENALREVEGASEDYQRVLLRCLAKADNRYATMDQLLDDVHALQAQLQPSIHPDEVGDDDAYVLGVIVNELSISSESVAPHQIERAVSGMSALALRVAHKKLHRLKLVETFTDEDYNGNEFQMVRLTQLGDAWLEKNRERTDGLLRARAPRVLAPDPDIPF
jgi:serine/threonine protein kinase